MTTRIYTIEDIKKMLKEVFEPTEVEKNRKDRDSDL